MAERNFPRGFPQVQTAGRLEPLAVFVDERHRGDGHPEEVRGDPGDALEGGLGRRVQNRVIKQGPQACRLVPHGGGGDGRRGFS